MKMFTISHDFNCFGSLILLKTFDQKNFFDVAKMLIDEVNKIFIFRGKIIESSNNNYF